MAWTSKDWKRNEEKLRLRELQSDLHLGQMDQSEVQDVHPRQAEKHQMKIYIRSWIQ
jgi:hypothetical protein